MFLKLSDYSLKDPILCTFTGFWCCFCGQISEQKKLFSFSLLLKDFFSLSVWNALFWLLSPSDGDVALTWSGSREQILADCVTYWCSSVTEEKFGLKTGCFEPVMCSVFCGIVGNPLWCTFISLQAFYMHKNVVVLHKRTTEKQNMGFFIHRCCLESE